jgi:hypothetical protein
MLGEATSQFPTLQVRKEMHSSPQERLTIKLVKREKNQVTQNPIENPWEQMAMGSESEGMVIHRNPEQAYSGYWLGSK